MKLFEDKKLVRIVLSIILATSFICIAQNIHNNNIEEQYGNPLNFITD